MATVVLQTVGGGLGALFGGPIGGIIGRAAGAIAGNVIDQQLFGSTRRAEGPRLSDLRVMSSSEGDPIPRVWGRMRVAGQVIWATNFEEVADTDTDSASAKGGGGGGTEVTTYKYFANFALALCEREIDGIGRVWADGKDLDISGLTARLHLGSETQEPDSLIAAKEGADEAPAYRGLAYLVFERLPLSDFGNRLPQLSVEVFRSVGGAEKHVRAASIIPGSTEFGYDTRIVTREVEEGVTEPENAHASGVRSDWSVSIDQLAQSCHNLEAASLVVAWFGNDLRCGSCLLRPGVERIAKQTDPDTWMVNGISRAAAHVVSTSGGGPAFGGTPSDPSVIRAIQDLKARGLKAVFYPFIMMDVPPGNARPDPYGGAEQAAYPWRGRITAAIAPGRTGTPDKSPAAEAEIASFVGTAAPSHFTAGELTVNYAGPPEWSYRRMVLHYAKLCALAGGVDAFLIGSELRGLTTLRGGGNSFPFVQALAALAAEVKAILPATKVSYAADWSEYFGHQPADGTGDVFFHLDPLWSSPAVDFIGIDNYMPLSDWRDGRQHTDFLAGAQSLHDLDYLKSNIAGGEGFDWFYANDAARDAQLRSPITDGAHGKPWVFRFKDLKSWWENPHHDRPGGIESPVATAWTPRAKPFWFTEAGCAAIDKATNQPNVFIDPKSSENLLPHFSSGQRDDLIQNRYVTALGEYWSAPGAHNPVSPVYGGRMVDPSRIFWWAWDARPFPQFPARRDVWADAANYDRGHWLNGRIGAVPLGALIRSVCEDYGVAGVESGGVEGLIDGFAIDRPMSARDALEGLMAIHGIDAVESQGALRFFMRGRPAGAEVEEQGLVETEPDRPLYSLRRAQETELPAAVKLAYVESALDYRLAAVEARQSGGSSLRNLRIELAGAVSQAEAQKRADVALQESWAARETMDLALPPTMLALEPGDAVAIQLASGTLHFRIEEISDGICRKIRARSFDAAVHEPPDAAPRGVEAASAIVYGRPVALFMDLPIARDGAAPHAPWLAATAVPWPGALALHRRVGPSAYGFNRLIGLRATTGRLTSPLLKGPLHVLDRGSSFEVTLTTGALFSVSVDELLQGGNVAAVGSPSSGWEIIQFATAELIGTNRYRLSLLLRGQSGSDPEMAAARAPGERFVLLNAAVVQPVLSLGEASLSNTWKIGPVQYDLERSRVTIAHSSSMMGLRPLPPCHARAVRQDGGVLFTWIRRTRIDGDSWDLAEVPLGEERESYSLEIMDGGVVRRAVTANAPSHFYSGPAIAADFGADPGSFTIRVSQLSASYGRGAPLERTLHV